MAGVLVIYLDRPNDSIPCLWPFSCPTNPSPIVLPAAADSNKLPSFHEKFQLRVELWDLSPCCNCIVHGAFSKLVPVAARTRQLPVECHSEHFHPLDPPISSILDTHRISLKTWLSLAPPFPPDPFLSSNHLGLRLAPSLSISNITPPPHRPCW